VFQMRDIDVFMSFLYLKSYMVVDLQLPSFFVHTPLMSFFFPSTISIPEGVCRTSRQRTIHRLCFRGDQQTPPLPLFSPQYIERSKEGDLEQLTVFLPRWHRRTRSWPPSECHTSLPGGAASSPHCSMMRRAKKFLLLLPDGIIIEIIGGSTTTRD
jgi:hypothetical protein